MLPFNIFDVRLTNINSYLHLLSGSEKINNLNEADLNKILIHAVPNGWAKHSYLQGWYFESNTIKETCDMLEIMDIPEKVYKGR